MSHAYDRDRARKGLARRRSPDQPNEDRERARLEALQEAVGNAAMARMLDQRTTTDIESQLGGGTPLDVDTRPAQADLDAQAPGPGADHSAGADHSVRIHDDARASELSSRLGAVAFTFGRDIFLAGDAPAIDSPAGRRMLRHELTHVRQQEATGASRPTRLSSPSGPAEREASRAADGVSTTAGTASDAAVHRQVEEEEEEEMVMAMPAETVHRQVAEEEEVEDFEADVAVVGGPDEETAEESTEEPAEEPANPALAALFQTSVIDKAEAARAALGSEPPDAASAHAAFIDASNAISALAPVYQESDPLLHAELMRLGNGTAMYIEILEPHVHGSRSLPDVHAALQSSNYNALASGIRDRLH